MRDKKVYVRPPMRDEVVRPHGPNYYEVSVTIHGRNSSTGAWLKGETVVYGDFRSHEEAKGFADFAARIDEGAKECQTNETTTKG